MRSARINLLVDPAELSSGEVEIRGDAYRHLFRARRLAIGQQLRVVDGNGAARWGLVERVATTYAVVSLGASAPSRLPVRSVVVAVALIRPERVAWLVEKSTELGVEAIRLFRSERTPRRIGELRLERLRRVQRAAAEQSGVARLPRLTADESLDALIGRLGSRPLVVLEPGAAPLVTAVGGSHPLAVLIGPEGGLSEAELTRLDASGAARASLGDSVLRTETAALVAAAVCLLGERISSSDGADEV